jgi:hypothetical protein
MCRISVCVNKPETFFPKHAPQREVDVDPLSELTPLHARHLLPYPQQNLRALRRRQDGYLCIPTSNVKANIRSLESFIFRVLRILELSIGLRENEWRR